MEFDLKNESIQNIEKFFSKKILGHNRPTINIAPSGLFRARIISDIKKEDLLRTKCIWYPDWAEIDKSNYKFNRCSDKGQNFFYSSNLMETTINELNPNNGDTVLIGVFHLKFRKTKIRSQFAGIESLRNHPNHKKSLENYKYPTKKDRLFEEFISSKFQERISNGNEYLYKNSIALCNILLKNKDISCVIYPSVASNLKLVNYGLKPEFVDKFLFCTITYIFKVCKTNSEFILTPEKYGIIKNPYEIKKSKIEWKNYKLEDKQRELIKFSF